MAAAPNQVLAISPQVNFFQPEEINDSVESSLLEEYLPVGFTPDNLNDPINFHIRGTEQWLDFSKSYAYFRGRITGTATIDGAAKTASQIGERFALTNNFFDNQISSIEVRVNDTSISSNNENHPYASYIQKLFNNSMQAEHSLGGLSMWKIDEAGKMDSFSKHVNGTGNDAWKITTPGNEGAVQRFSYFAHKDDCIVEGVIQLCHPLFKLKPYFISFAHVDVVLHRNIKPAFYFMYNADDCPFKFKLEAVKMKIRKVKLNASIVESIEQMMVKESEPISYKLLDARVFTKTYAGYGTEIIEDNLFHGVLPNRIIFGFVTNAAYTGKFAKNPFHFQHLNIQEVSMTVNGQHFPIPPLQMDFETGQTAEAFYQMMDSVHSVKSTTPPLISHAMFKNGFTLFSYDMSADQHGSKNHYQISNQPANIRLYVRFKQGAANENVTLIVYYEVNSQLNINHTRQVTLHSALK